MVRKAISSLRPSQAKVRAYAVQAPGGGSMRSGASSSDGDRPSLAATRSTIQFPNLSDCILLRINRSDDSLPSHGAVGAQGFPLGAMATVATLLVTPPLRTWTGTWQPWGAWSGIRNRI